MEAPTRYDYSAIIDRPPLVFPGAAKVALWLIVNVEHYEYLPRPHPQRDPWPARPHPDVVNYARRDYGNRVGLWRMLDLLDRYELKATISINAAVLDHYPHIAEALAARPVDFMGHGVYNTRYVAGLDVDAERELIDDVQQTVLRRTGRPVTGWLGPSLTTTPATPDLIAEAGVSYLADFLHDDEPCPLRVRTGRLVSMPYSLALNDSPLIGRMQHSAATFARVVTDQFDVLYDEGRHRPKVLAVCLHPYAVNAPSRQEALERTLRYVVEQPDVWVATGTEIATIGADAWWGGTSTEEQR
ncbi:polysaccharide deacetylase family protein [Micromonospora sp. NPDC047740]|uniref:polysaccharide deacetylase family protein n=1 Tax=Micromonospora sp. NPDC047740 TaxID=3364254 RepID=UPI003710CE49